MDWLGLTLIGAFLLALYTILQKNILKKEHTFEFTIIVYLAGFIYLLPFFIQTDFSVFSNMDLLLLIIRGILTSTGFLFLVKAYRHSEISSVSSMINFSPVILVILSFILIQEKLSFFEFLGLALIIFGTYFLEIDKTKGLLYPIKQIINSKTMHNIIITMVLWSLSAILEKYVLTNLNVSIYSLLSISYASSSLWLLSFYFYKYRDLSKLIYSIKHYGLMTALVSAIELSSVIFHLMAIAIPASKIGLIIPLRRMASIIEIIIGGKLMHEENLTQKSIAGLIMIFGVFMIVI